MPAAIYSNMMSSVCGRSQMVLKHFSLSDETLNPPFFDRKVDNYIKWKRLLDIWLHVTDIPKTKQGGVIILRLDDDTIDEVMEVLTCKDVSTEDGLQKVLRILDNIFLVDQSLVVYGDYEDFVKYERPEHMSVKEYCCQFQRKVVKVQTSGSVIADNVLAYKLLKCARLTSFDEKLIKATTEMNYGDVLRKLKCVFEFHNISGNLNISSEVCSKEERGQNNDTGCTVGYLRGHTGEVGYRDTDITQADHVQDCQFKGESCTNDTTAPHKLMFIDTEEPGYKTTGWTEKSSESNCSISSTGITISPQPCDSANVEVDCALYNNHSCTHISALFKRRATPQREKRKRRRKQARTITLNLHNRVREKQSRMAWIWRKRHSLANQIKSQKRVRCRNEGKKVWVRWKRRKKKLTSREACIGEEKLKQKNEYLNKTMSPLFHDTASLKKRRKEKKKRVRYKDSMLYTDECCG